MLKVLAPTVARKSADDALLVQRRWAVPRRELRLEDRLDRLVTLCEQLAVALEGRAR
jgi:hypothetical protein